MEQVSQYLDGERDYTLIKGGTGPLVYPAAHVYIYSTLHYVTDGGKDILLAQIIFGGLYLGTLSLVMACYRAAKVRPRALVHLVSLTDSDTFRHPRTSFLSSSCPSVYTASSFSDCSMIASPWGHYFWQSMYIKNGYGQSAASSILSVLASR